MKQLLSLSNTPMVELVLLHVTPGPNFIMKRNTLEPTLEDHCDKSVLPSVMQVKDFGRSGRTKWTHLTSEDTTAFDNPWASKENQTHLKIGGGMKQVFEKPSAKRKKMT